MIFIFSPCQAVFPAFVLLVLVYFIINYLSICHYMIDSQLEIVKRLLKLAEITKAPNIY